MSEIRPQAAALAELIVHLGANVQPGQIVSISSEPGKEEMARAVAEAAYARGAQFVDLNVFDAYFKRARVRHADPDTLGFVPPWYGTRMLALGEHRAATVSLAGPAAPHALDGLDPGLVGRDLLPSVAESGRVVNARLCNWTVAPCPTDGWARLVYPDLDPAAALERLWEEIAHVCRLDEPDPVAAWAARMASLRDVTARLEALALDSLHFSGPGTDLTVGLMASSRWLAATLTTVDGIEHAANLPTEEVFTVPDPTRTVGTVRSTKPLFVADTTVLGLRLRFEGGRAIEIDADAGAETVRSLVEGNEGAERLGEVALVDRESRIGSLGTIFYETLLDENAASHIALGQGLSFACGEADAPRVNESPVHVDFMIGSDEVTVSGRTREGSSLTLLQGGRWQL